ncbi:MAG: OmpA family protein [Cytophagales bacterium]
MKKLLIIMMAFLAIFSCHAQSKKKSKSKTVAEKKTKLPPELDRKLKLADRLMEEKSYYNAIDLYLSFEKQMPGYEDVVFKTAMAYFTTRDYKNAEKYFLRYVPNKDYKKYPIAVFYYAETLKALGKYENAIKAYEAATKLKPNKKDTEIQDIIKFAKNEVKSTDWALKMSDEDSTLHRILKMMGIANRAYSDFSPYPIHEDTLLFASLQGDSVIKYTHDDHHFHAIKLYETVRDKESGAWGEPIELVEFNTTYAHTANGVLSPDGKYFYFTRCEPNRDNVVVCDIYYVEHDNDKIKQHKPKKVSGVNLDDYTTTQPTFQTIEKKGKKGEKSTSFVLYFSSNRPGGQGGRDLWFAIMETHGKFKKPVNCGNRINTPRDEVTPFYDDKEGILYFSSNFHYGFGGQDIFKAQGAQNKWQKPENLMFPLNSTYDDTYYVLSRSDAKSGYESGYVVSNRPGGIALHSETCCDDIYSFKEVELNQQLLIGKTFYQELISSSESSSDSLKKKINYISDTKIGYITAKNYNKFSQSGDTSFYSMKESIEWLSQSGVDGSFSTQVPKNKKVFLVAQKEGFLPSIVKQFNQDSINIELVKIPETPKKDTIQQIAANIKKLDEKSDANVGEKLVLENMYFDYNKDVYKKESLPSLNLLLNFLNKFPKAKIEISGHTDNRGSDEYNQDLSQRRCETIRAWLIYKGIDEKRLTAVGYGETQAIAPNENADGSDNPEGRALNRRVEIKILSN